MCAHCTKRFVSLHGQSVASPFCHGDSRNLLNSVGCFLFEWCNQEKVLNCFLEFLFYFLFVGESGHDVLKRKKSSSAFLNQVVTKSLKNNGF